MTDQNELTAEEWCDATTYELIDWHKVFNGIEERDKAWDRFIAKMKADAWDEGVMAVRDWWEAPDDEKYVIFNPYGTHPADRLLDDINANGESNE